MNMEITLFHLLKLLIKALGAGVTLILCVFCMKNPLLVQRCPSCQLKRLQGSHNYAITVYGRQAGVAYGFGMVPKNWNFGMSFQTTQTFHTELRAVLWVQDVHGRTFEVGILVPTHNRSSESRGRLRDFKDERTPNIGTGFEVRTFFVTHSYNRPRISSFPFPSLALWGWQCLCSISSEALWPLHPCP